MVKELFIFSSILFYLCLDYGELDTHDPEQFDIYQGQEITFSCKGVGGIEFQKVDFIHYKVHGFALHL